MNKSFILKAIVCFIVLFHGIVTVWAQPALKSYQHQGYIIDVDGNKIEGIIELDAWSRLWMNQGTIGFVSNAKVEELKKAGKKKIPVKWYRAAHLKGYGYDNKQFVTKNVRLTTGISKRMIEVISEKEKTFKFYNSSIPGATPPQSFVTLRENSQGIVE